MNFPILCSQAPYGSDCCCCKRCSVGGCDVRVIPCGCCLHARCCAVSEGNLLQSCPVCGQATTGLHLIPIAFDEIDQATAEAANTSLTNKRGKKRQNATVARLNPSIQKTSTASGGGDDGSASAAVGESSDLRTGRWTPEETAYCDKLIQLFESGSLPVPEKTKLNDFLSNMLKSKQSRLTKKMKNAKLSAKQYRRQLGYILDDTEARDFSKLETALFGSMKCRMERAELRFHMQKVWRELFSGFCVSIGQKLELDAWLRSVEEMERRASQAMDAARRARRKAMIGYALDEDTKNAQTGVMINPNAFVDRSSQVVVDQNGDFAEVGSETELVIGNSSNKRQRTGGANGSMANRPKAKSSSFVARVMLYVQQRRIPFEHVDVWAPCIGNSLDLAGGSNQEQNRLTFAGCATADSKLQPTDTESRVVPLTSKEQCDLLAFGEYSQRFSFKVGSGLPGRVFSSGVASWEQGLGSAPKSFFERGGGAKQWGLETALGIPVTSPNVGRVVVIFYSIHDRPRDEPLVGRMKDELSRLIPVPRWKLVVDVGADATTPDVTPVVNDSRENDLKNLLQSILVGNLNPNNGGLTAQISQSMTGLYPLSQLIFKSDRTPMDKELLQQALASFDIYKQQGRADLEVVWMTCRDYVLREPEIRKKHQAATPPTGLTQFNAQIPAASLGMTAASSQPSCCPPSQSQSTSCCPPQPVKQCCPPSNTQSSGCCPPPSAAPTCQAQQQQQQQQCAAKSSCQSQQQCAAKSSCQAQQRQCTANSAGCCPQSAPPASGCCSAPAQRTCPVQQQQQQQQCAAKSQGCCAPPAAPVCTADQAQVQQQQISQQVAGTSNVSTDAAHPATVSVQTETTQAPDPNAHAPTTLTENSQATDPNTHDATTIDNNNIPTQEDPLAPNAVHNDVHTVHNSDMAGTALNAPENHALALGQNMESFMNETSDFGGGGGGNTEENMDLGVSATQLAQLFQSEATGFTFS